MKKFTKIIIVIVMLIILTLINVWAFQYANAQRPAPAIGGEYMLPPACIVIIAHIVARLFRRAP